KRDMYAHKHTGQRCTCMIWFEFIYTIAKGRKGGGREREREKEREREREREEGGRELEEGKERHVRT
ncbi:MAG: hypothetical protein MJE68_03950, partial [Proteobacteria bacterium]|nr:hypothetical protein [Pseudomonadota bacterium]